MADKILNSFDVWIGAQGWKSKLRLKSIDNISLEGVARLRELILELAVFGKLIPQDSSDEDANVLVKKIAVERERLIRHGELKKQKPLSEITDDQKYFELPKGWTWVKLGNIGETNIGLTYSPKDVSDRGMPVLRSSNVQNGEISLDDLVRVSSKIDSKNFVENGDLLICARNGSKKLVGKCAIIKDLKEKMSFGAFMAIFRSPLNFYIKYFLESPFYRNRLEDVSTTTINQITQDNLKNTVIPLPPLSEQHRIVAKVDELMALCDELEQQETNHLKSHQLLVETLLGTLTQAKDASEFQTAWATLAQHFDDLFITEDSIDQLKQTILQLAVMGKLVPQDPNDEPASVLLERIRKEKERLVEEGKIRKLRKLPNLEPEEKPFELPEKWEWSRFGELGEFINGDRSSNYPHTSEYVEKGIAWINTGHIEKDGTLSVHSMNFITEEKYNSLKGGKILPDDLVYCLRGATFGKTAFVYPYKQGAIASSLMIIRLYKLLNSRYIFYYLKSPFAKQQLERFDNGSAQPNLAANDVSFYSFPLPPLDMQNRIVARIDELFTLCDRLQKRITEAQRVSNLMAETVADLV